MKSAAAEEFRQVRREDSLKKRYAYKLGANLFALPITLGIAAIVTRMLGPASYGDYNFLSTFFTQIVAFIDTGTSAAFYSKLSQRPNETGLVRFFWLVIGIVSTLVLAFVVVVFAAGWAGTLWPDQEMRYVVMAVVWGLLMWYSQVINKAVDTYGLTVPGEIVRFTQKILAFALILLMYWSGQFSLTEFYLYQYITLLVLCFAWGIVLQRNGRTLFPKMKLVAGQLKSYAREFYDYSMPLLLLGVVGLFGGVFDRWLLQKFAGSVQQGYFSIAFQIGAFCFLVSGAMTPLFWREVAKAFGDSNMPHMKRLFERTVRIMYVITALLAVFIALHAEEMSLLLGGSDFKQAALPISILVFYPIHQTYGQLTGSLLLGTGQTKILRNLGILTMVFGLILSFWLLAPTTEFGLGLGATGLAIKMVVEQFVAVNLQLWFITRYLKISFGSLVMHQLYSVALLVGLAWSSAQITNLVIQDPLSALLFSGVLYLVSVAGLAVLFPAFLSMTRQELQGNYQAVIQQAKK